MLISVHSGFAEREGDRETERETDRQTYHARVQEFSSEIYHFSRFQRGSNIFQGGPTFSGGGGDPIAYSL